MDVQGTVGSNLSGSGGISKPDRTETMNQTLKEAIHVHCVGRESGAGGRTPSVPSEADMPEIWLHIEAPSRESEERGTVRTTGMEIQVLPFGRCRAFLERK